MKRKKVFSFFAASAVALSSLAFPAKQAQAQFGWIPYAGSYIDMAIGAAQGRYTPLDIVGNFVPGVGGEIISYVGTGIDIATGRRGVVEGVLGIVGVSVGGTAGSILSNISSGIGTARQISGMSYYGNTLTYGEAYQHTWQFRDADGNVDYVDAKEWKLSYTDGEAKFVLVLNDGREQEYPIEGLYYEEDLKYLCNFLIVRLEELGDVPVEETAVDDEARESLSQKVATLSENLLKITDRIDNVASNPDSEAAKEELQVFFRYINDELCSVSVGLMTIEPGTEPGQIKTIRIRGEMYTFRWCPAGEFTRQAIVGQQTVEKEEWYGRDRYGRRIKLRTPRMTTVTEDVKGEQRVTLREGFWILDSEVTRQMYERVVAMRMRGTLSNPQYPSTNVTWSDADKFCEELSKITQKHISLPTEAEWQYACRAGADTVDLDLVAWYKANSGSYGQSAYGRRYNSRQYSYQTQHDVKTKEPNAWGIYDMNGNVSEWCADWEGAETSAETAVDPTGPATGTKRVVCGGNYTSPAENCVFDYAVGNLPNQKVGTIGFRVILIPDPPKEGAETANVNNVPSVGGNPDSLTTDADDANQADEDAPAVPEDEVISPDSEEKPETTPETENLNGFESTDENADDASESADAEETGNEAGNAEAGETAETDEPKAPSFADPDDREKLLNALRDANVDQNAAEQVPEAPAQAPQAPAQTEGAPAQTEEAPAQAPEAPAQTEEEPDQVPQAPAQAQKAPEQTQKAPVQTQKAPEQVQKAPVQAQKAPEQVQKN